MALSCHIGKKGSVEVYAGTSVDARAYITLTVSLLAAGGWNNAVQTQVFDHLTVVIEGMAHCS